MVTQYIYGVPVETFAAVKEVEHGKELPYFSWEKDMTFTCPLGKEDIVYGLGETMRGINKRGARYISFNYDDSRHRDDMPSMYGSHNFIVVDGEKTFGAFFDTPAKVVFDIDSAGDGLLSVACESSDLRLYIVEGGSAYSVVKEFLGIIGRSFLPPLWAFGYGQSRWGYKTARDISRVAAKHREAGIPLDYICLDIDYMDRYIDFTVHKRRFPKMAAYVKMMLEQGLHLVPIVDAGIKVEPGNAVYEEGVEKGCFCKNQDGRDFQAEVWPGMTHFPDFMRETVRAWFGSQYRFYTELGLEGFWNDMNEPAIFSTESRKKNAPPDAERGDPDQPGRHIADYKDFFHRLDDGRRISNYKVHNVYGAMMTKASGEGLEKLLDKRYLLFSRSSYIGAHRYGGIWTGDNESSWRMLRQNVYHMPSLNMCGFLYSGADTGGFGGNTSRELLLRWLAFSVFTPLMRNHSAIGTRKQECYRFRGTEDFQSIISLRYRLLPYLYSEYMKAALRQDMLIRPLAFDYPDDEKARRIEDQLMVGEGIMIAPILEKGVNGRIVYLPEPMTEVRYSGGSFTCMDVGAGERTAMAPLNTVVFYIRRGKLVPVGKAVSNTAEMDLLDVELLGSGTSYEQYVDDGSTKECSLDRCVVRRP
ncbi:MAG: alpha-glucosidase [Oscillospiraceae bacterium]|nr:alpha-glucosidase [Oscillospiraceae bacterium]